MLAITATPPAPTTQRAAPSAQILRRALRAKTRTSPRPLRDGGMPFAVAAEGSPTWLGALPKMGKEGLASRRTAGKARSPKA